MLALLLEASIRRRWAVLLCTLAFAALGARAFVLLPIDAVPDLTNVQVQVLTNAPSLGALDVERLVTAPVERALGGLPHVDQLRSLSRAGVSAVTVVFHDDVDPYFVRQLVSERLPQIRQSVDARYGVPELGPMATGLGEIYQFEVRGEGRSVMELRSILDWEVAPRLRMVPGIVEVNTFGGELRTYEVSVDPARMAAQGVSLGDVVGALEASNHIAGGGVIARGPEGMLVRGEGAIRSLDDLRRVVVADRPGAPLLLGQVAEPRFAPMLRWGAATRDARGDVVVGMALMLMGENSRSVSRSVDEAVQSINASLPRGVRVETFYDRTTLVERTLRTVRNSLAEGGLLVVVLLFVMLRNVRAGLVAGAMIPLCLAGAFIGMRVLGVSGNLMSLGAIDFGLVVDGAIILLENAVHHLSEECARLGRPLTRAERDSVVLRSAQEVRGATAFGEVIIGLVYLPILALEGVEGRLFRPMALTVLFALATAFVLSLTFVPALASVALPAFVRDAPSPVVTGARRVYEPLLRLTLRRPLGTALVAVAALAVSVIIGARLGSDFVPTLDEGSLLIEMQRPPSVSLTEAARQAGALERVLRRFPEVTTVVSKTGRPEIANDPTGPEQSDVLVMLRPRAEWPPPRDREDLVRRMSSALDAEVPGVNFGFSQPIQMRTNELVSGIRADFAVKIYGEDLPTLARLGARAARLLSEVHGAVDVRVDRVEGAPVLRAELDRDALARRGVSASAALRVIEALGGITVGEVLEGRRRYPLRVRLDEPARATVDAVRTMPLRLPDGALVPFGELARVEVSNDPAVVNREAGQRRLIVQANVRGRDLGGFADEAQARVRRGLRTPEGYHLEWGGQFENLRRARLRLAVVVPAALLVILALLYASFDALRPALVIFANVPFAGVGGVMALAARGLPFSISAAVGFVALFGVAVLNGLVLVTQVRALRAEGFGPIEASRDGALRRLRPVLTTALVASLGFVPMAFANGDGAEVQRPLATVVIGGLVSATLLTLLVLPTVLARLDRSPAREESAGAAPPSSAA